MFNKTGQHENSQSPRSNYINLRTIKCKNNNITEYGNYPNEIKTLSEKLNLNLIEKYITDKIVYKKTENEYILELKFLNHNLKEFDNETRDISEVTSVREKS